MNLRTDLKKRTDLSQKVTFSPRANVKSLNLKAGDLDGDEALEDQVEVDHAAHRHFLVQSDLDLKGDGGAVLDENWERSHRHHVEGEWFRAAIWERMIS